MNVNKTIIVQDLRKSYGAVQAVKGISFSVDEGALFAFLGRNGAGKSTTIDIICTALAPDSGSVAVCGYTLGKDDDKIRESIGVVFQQGMLDKLLTVEENLVARGGLYGLSGKNLAAAISRVAGETGVSELLKRQYGKLSGGQRRRCDIARALLCRPKILFLDEPTTGLDPQSRKAIWDTIRRVQKENGMTVFLTTHYMEEAAEADCIVVIDGGNITASGSPSQLKERYASDRLVLSCKDMAAVKAVLNASGTAFREVSDTLIVSIPETLSAIPVLNACINEIYSFEVIKGTLDDAFIEITGGEPEA